MITHSNSDYLYQIGFHLGTAVVLSLLSYLLLNRLSKVSFANKRLWLLSFLDALYYPIVALIWVIAASFVVAIMYTQLTTQTLPQIHNFQKLFIIIDLLWIGLRFLNCSHRNLLARAKVRKKKVNHSTIDASFQFLRVLCIVIGILILLPTMGISISALLTVGGIGTLAIGFAAKDSLANFLGGIMIFVDKPFAVGDWIQSPDRNVQGTVEKIGWRLTRIRTFDKRPLYVPNAAFSVISVENAQRMQFRRIKTQISLRYQDAAVMADVMAAIKEMLLNHPEIATDQTTMVNLDAFAESSLNFLLYCFTKTTEWVKFQAIQQDVFLKIIEIVHAHGADFAFPTRTLDMPNNIINPMRTSNA